MHHSLPCPQSLPSVYHLFTLSPKPTTCGEDIPMYSKLTTIQKYPKLVYKSCIFLVSEKVNMSAQTCAGVTHTTDLSTGTLLSCCMIMFQFKIFRKDNWLTSGLICGSPKSDCLPQNSLPSIYLR